MFDPRDHLFLIGSLRPTNEAYEETIDGIGQAYGSIRQGFC
jgi:hypothetical protein